MKMTHVGLMLLMSLIFTVPVLAHDGEDHGTQKAQKAHKAEKSKAPKTMYECPMKDSPAQDKPGKCPTCGMPLEKVTVPDVKKTSLEETKCTCSKEGHESHEHGTCAACAKKSEKAMPSKDKTACKDGQAC